MSRNSITSSIESNDTCSSYNTVDSLTHTSSQDKNSPSYYYGSAYESPKRPLTRAQTRALKGRIVANTIYDSDSSDIEIISEVPPNHDKTHKRVCFQPSATRSRQDSIGRRRLGPTPRNKPIRQCAINYGTGSGKGGLKRMAQVIKPENVQVSENEDSDTEDMTVKQIMDKHEQLSSRAASLLQPFTKFVRTLATKVDRERDGDGLRSMAKLRLASRTCLNTYFKDCQTYVTYAKSVTLMLDQLSINGSRRRHAIDFYS